MKIALNLVILLLLLTAGAPARSRSPLTAAEADQLRGQASEPYKRMRLYLEFAEVRLQAIDRLRSDSKMAEGRGQKIHALLNDFISLIDEINDNLDQYQGRPLSRYEEEEFQRALRAVIEADNRFELRLTTFRTAPATAPPSELKAYVYVLEDARDAVRSNAETCREYQIDKQH